MRLHSLSILLAFSTVLCAPAAADEPATTFSLDGTTTAVTPGATYGPWDWMIAAYRTTVGEDKPGLQIITRSDRDTGAPTSGTSYILDDYHQFSEHAYGYASLQLSSGQLFPTRGLYLEGDASVANGVAFGTGVGWLANPDGSSQQFMSIGPTMYFPHGNATLRYLPLWTRGDMGASSFLAAATIGDESHTSATLTLQDGVVPAYAANQVLLTTGVSERAFAAELTTRHFITPRFGYDVGLSYANVTDRQTNTFEYSSYGFTFGLVWGRPAPAPHP
ncbi:MAG TPA: YaiO family outer membrane beta-barrel protein [Candidatus Acidoferrum sp.]|jgi:YaiO family outer membrane protein|nr:YaiO family outer membrane beta-barrel protein [Candidatus Acidoferrum sp.]